ncbi:MAG: Mth938-like domain-containing protein [Beijerinckiaceae bacterium]
MPAPVRVYDGFLPGRHAIAGFGRGGFRFADMSHQGSIMALPSGIHRWEPPEPFLHNEPMYDKVLEESGDIDVLLIGAGLVPLPIPEALRWRFRERGISADVMTTASAASTYNVLLDEGRRVAAALVAVA